MARVVVLGAGISGHTAVMVLRKKLNKKHEVIMVSPNSNYQWIPSNIWVGIGQMKPKQVMFPLAPVYKRKGVIFKQALAKTIFPDGDGAMTNPFVEVEYVAEGKKGQTEKVGYDYLINATGPKLNFAATEGLGPDKFTNSVCTYHHAEKSWKNLQVSLDKMANGEKQRFVIGTGHPMATCQGAAFEYILNVAFEINKRKLMDKAEITWITNEYEVGDFGMGGAFIKKGGYVTSTKIFTESILAEYGIKWIKRAGVKKVEDGKIHYETLDGNEKTIEFDFSMLIPAFAGVGITAKNKAGEDITSQLFAPNGLMKVDADYTPKDFNDWSVDDWPTTYQSPVYENVFASGIAFAPPHSISKPFKSKNGTPIFPTPPRTGMPSGVIGKVVALNVAESIKKGKVSVEHKASMGRMGAACIVSSGYGIWDGMAATMTVYPVVPDFEKYPEWGRDLKYTVGEPGLAGHWMKLFMHYLFLYKAKAKLGWSMIPE
ncbi:MAG: sulfide:quinone reductase [Bacteroidetes bacterium 4484_276]|nr:MAG: sulfide:quinone reductase [Bacteroidetes bacterium 4484_276]OYT13027.1 MAG: sulfide:quinone reductase [Bacteroidetes bacterium 4572_114]